VCVENATIGDLAEALAAGRTSAADLVRAYTARIEAYDRAGPRLNAVREVNPDALAIAQRLDAGKSEQRRPLEGIPVLVKDNIATGDAQHTTAGSLALADVQAQRDATVVKLLRQAGAVILGKANLTEFANVLALDMPAGYSSLGGQVRNPYAPQLDDRGVPIKRFDKCGPAAHMRIHDHIAWLGEGLDRRFGKSGGKSCGVFVEPVRQAAHRVTVARRGDQPRLRGIQ
jgi:amidase